MQEEEDALYVPVIFILFTYYIKMNCAQSNFSCFFMFFRFYVFCNQTHYSFHKICAVIPLAQLSTQTNSCVFCKTSRPTLSPSSILLNDCHVIFMRGYSGIGGNMTTYL